MGTPLPWVDAVILDLATHQPAATPTAIGLLAFRPGWPSMMAGYWQNDTATAHKISNGWFVTGDQARMDEDGYVWFVGRDDDIINTAGHLLSPFEVESALLEHAAVAESAVVAMPDPVNMEVVKAIVVLAPGCTPSDDLTLELTNHVRRRVASFAMPRVIEYVTALPRTRSGKIMRRVLRAQAWGQAVGDTSAAEGAIL
ncbi:MAG: AMP-binding protein [bacterium]|nr:AMP-binding protein [bacterium]